jgi:hypothetical protein
MVVERLEGVVGGLVEGLEEESNTRVYEGDGGEGSERQDRRCWWQRRGGQPDEGFAGGETVGRVGRGLSAGETVKGDVEGIGRQRLGQEGREVGVEVVGQAGDGGLGRGIEAEDDGVAMERAEVAVGVNPRGDSRRDREGVGVWVERIGDEVSDTMTESRIRLHKALSSGGGVDGRGDVARKR